MSEPSPKEKTRCDDAALSPNEDPYCHDLTQSSYIIQYDILDLLTTYVTKKGPISPAHLRDFVTELVNILRKPAALEVLLSLIEFKAATAHSLHRRLNLASKSIYRVLEFLEVKGLVVQTLTINTKGRRATVYALCNHTPDDVAEAVQRDRITRTSGYTEVKRVRQLLLDDFWGEITLQYKGMTLLNERKALEIVRRECPGYDHKVLWSLIKSDPLPVDGYYLT